MGVRAGPVMLEGVHACMRACVRLGGAVAWVSVGGCFFLTHWIVLDVLVRAYDLDVS